MFGTKYYFLFKGQCALTSPIVREWLSTMALPASPSSSVGQPLSPRHDMPQVDSPQEEREQVGEDMLEFADDNEEDFKEYEIIKGGNIYGCTMHSGLNFANHEELRSHISKHQKQCICDQCNKGYSSKYNLENHVQTKHWGVTPQVKCTIEGCVAMFHTRNGFYKHFNREHKCDSCKIICASLSELQEHCCGVDKGLICMYCSKEFKTSQTCKRHIEESCLSNPEVMMKKYPYKCDVCGDSFSDKNYLLKHTDIAHGRRGNKYPCHKCSATFHNRDLATEHIKNCH